MAQRTSSWSSLYDDIAMPLWSLENPSKEELELRTQYEKQLMGHVTGSLEKLDYSENRADIRGVISNTASGLASAGIGIGLTGIIFAIGAFYIYKEVIK